MTNVAIIANHDDKVIVAKLRDDGSVYLQAGNLSDAFARPLR